MQKFKALRQRAKNTFICSCWLVVVGGGGDGGVFRLFVVVVLGGGGETTWTRLTRFNHFC